MSSLVSLAAGDIFVPVTIEEKDLLSGIKDVLKVIRPHWPPEEIKFKTFTDGLTNKLVACQLRDNNSADNVVLVRIYGEKTDLLIDRNAEIRNMKTLNVLGLAPKIYGVFENGIAYQYCPGVTLTTSTVQDDQIWPLVAKQMAQMHKVELGKEITKESMVWSKMEQFLTLLPQPFNTEQKQTRFVNSFGSVTRLRVEYERLRSHLCSSASPLVFAHNDLLLGNVIFHEPSGSVSFIDYEYAGYNYQAFDIANHFNEFVGTCPEDIDYTRYPSKEFQTKWISTYLSEFYKEAPSNEQVEQVYKEVQRHSLSSHFLWGIWSLVQFEHSSIDFDFGRYAEIRLNRYFELKGEVLKESS